MLPQIRLVGYLSVVVAVIALVLFQLFPHPAESASIELPASIQHMFQRLTRLVYPGPLSAAKNSNQLLSNTARLNKRIMSSSQPSSAPADSESNAQGVPLPLPAPGEEATKLDVSSGEAVKLDHLGPIVVNTDGSLSRIANWEQMTEIERKNTLRIVSKRNKLRMEALQKAEAQANGQDATKE